MAQANQLIKIHNAQMKTELSDRLREYKLKPIFSGEQLQRWKKISAVVRQKIKRTQYESLFDDRFRRKGNFLYVAEANYISKSKYYEDLNIIYSLAVNLVNRYGLVDED